METESGRGGVDEDPATAYLRARLEVGSALGELRNAAGLTQNEASSKLDFSFSKLIRIEKGNVGVSRSDLMMMLNLYGVSSPEVRDRLAATAKLTYHTHRPKGAAPLKPMTTTDLIRELQELENVHGPMLVMAVSNLYRRSVGGVMSDLSGVKPVVLLMVPQYATPLRVSSDSPPEKPSE